MLLGTPVANPSCGTGGGRGWWLTGPQLGAAFDEFEPPSIASPGNPPGALWDVLDDANSWRQTASVPTCAGRRCAGGRAGRRTRRMWRREG